MSQNYDKRSRKFSVQLQHTQGIIQASIPDAWPPAFWCGSRPRLKPVSPRRAVCGRWAWTSLLGPGTSPVAAGPRGSPRTEPGEKTAPCRAGPRPCFVRPLFDRIAGGCVGPLRCLTGLLWVAGGTHSRLKTGFSSVASVETLAEDRRVYGESARGKKKAGRTIGLLMSQLWRKEVLQLCAHTTRARGRVRDVEWRRPYVQGRRA